MTFQTRETLIYRGQKRLIRALPLDHCRRRVPDFGVRTSACWRGYVGAWEVRDDVLHLVQLAAPFQDGNRNGLREMFPESAGPVAATWFSGEIVPDDVVNPEDDCRVATYKLNDWQLQFLWFTLVIYRGKLLLEAAINVEDGVTQTRLTKHVDALFPGPESAFLRAIHANVSDATPKLAYAYWLEERGDPRGPLLRAEVARLNKEGPRRRWAEENYRQDIPSGYIPPEDMLWYWRWIAGVPDMTAEDREYVERWPPRVHCDAKTGPAAPRQPQRFSFTTLVYLKLAIGGILGGLVMSAVGLDMHWQGALAILVGVAALALGIRNVAAGDR